MTIDPFRQAAYDGGWVFTSCHTYEPTCAVGLTPDGKAFQFSTDGGVAIFAMAGKIAQATAMEPMFPLMHELWESVR